MSKDEIIQYIEEHFDEVYKDCMKDCDGDEDIFVFQYMIKKFKKEMEQEKEKNGILQKELDKKIEALDKAMNNPDYISKDKIRELLKVIQKEKDIATKNILERDYNLAENGAICQELGYIEGELKKLLED